MKELSSEILRAEARNGEVRRREVASFALLLAAPLAVVAGLVAGPGPAQQVLALVGFLALIASMRLAVKPAGAARAVYLGGAAVSALTLAAGLMNQVNGGGMALEAPCTGLLIAAVGLFAARMKPSEADQCAVAADRP